MEQLPKHQSVLTDELLELLQPRSDNVYLDGTFGGGGHSRALLVASAPTGRVVAVDRDPEAAAFAPALRREFGQRFEFRTLPYEQARQLGLTFDGVVLDLGLSSDQLEDSGRGFSFQHPAEPLDLRFDATGGQTAAQFLQQGNLPQLERVFREYGQDRYWRRLSRVISEARRRAPIRTVGDFVAVVGTSDPNVLAPLFQALRIQVNDELGHLERGLVAIDGVLAENGRLAVISFQSLEDRIVKEFLRTRGYELLTKKPVMASEAEQAGNRRSRSAKLRGGIKRSSER